VLGLPVGDHPDSRPPQAALPDEAKAQIASAYQRAGLSTIFAPIPPG
jgi:4-hydroxy-tetrahydrodipicolinate synthase